MPSTETLVKIAVLGGPICLGGALFFHRKMQSNALLYYRPLFETYSKCISQCNGDVSCYYLSSNISIIMMHSLATVF